MSKQTRRAPSAEQDADTKVKNVAPEDSRRSGPGAQTNSKVKSGGNEDDDTVDEQSKESFPASDPPSSY